MPVEGFFDYADRKVLELGKRILWGSLEALGLTVLPSRKTPIPFSNIQLLLARTEGASEDEGLAILFE